MAAPICEGGTGRQTLYLAGAQETAKVTVPWNETDISEPLFKGTVAEFIAQAGDAGAQETLKRMLQNKIRKCAACGKPCAFTLKNCNACGASLEAIEITHNDNVFMGFVFGVEKGNFPFKISVRKQNEAYVCFDDPLALTSTHFNAIPTSTYIPDWRFLLNSPEKGLQIINDMFDICCQAAFEYFWQNEAFRTKFINKDAPIPATWQEVRDIVPAGMNFPPSMFQLHLQFLHPPWLPFQYNMLMNENHFHHGRFFPINYVRKVLECAIKNNLKYEINDDYPVEHLIADFDSRGVNYDSEQIKIIRQGKASQLKYGAWEQTDFKYVVMGSKVFDANTMEFKPDEDARKIQAVDATILNSYGTDSKGNKKTGTYYKFAKRASAVRAFPF